MCVLVVLSLLTLPLRVQKQKWRWRQAGRQRGGSKEVGGAVGARCLLLVGKGRTEGHVWCWDAVKPHNSCVVLWRSALLQGFFLSVLEGNFAIFYAVSASG